MKIYTVTFIHNNYGSSLQAFALQTLLKEMGGAPVVLLKKSRKKHSLIYNKFAAIWKLLHPQKDYNIYKRIRMIIEEKKSENKFKKINKFIFDNIDVLEIVDESDFGKTISNDSVFIAGSDQIWSTADHKLSPWYTFQWLDNKYSRFSYAASIGQDSLNERQINEYADSLSQFDIISLREIQAANLLKPLFGDKIRIDLDPTLLFDGVFWTGISSPRLINEPYVFVYRLRPNEDVINKAREVANKLHCRIIYSGLFSYKSKDIQCIYDAGVEEFLSYIKHAEAVVTNSFHGTVFSILFEKPFLSLKVKTTGSRAENLLNLLDIKSQLVDGDDLSYSLKVDYKKVNRLLEIEREKSKQYINYICNHTR